MLIASNVQSGDIIVKARKTFIHSVAGYNHSMGFPRYWNYKMLAKICNLRIYNKSNNMAFYIGVTFTSAISLTNVDYCMLKILWSITNLKAWLFTQYIVVSFTSATSLSFTLTSLYKESLASYDVIVSSHDACLSDHDCCTSQDKILTSPWLTPDVQCAMYSH